MKTIEKIIAWIIIFIAIAYDDIRTKIEDWNEKRLRNQVQKKLDEKKDNSI